MARSSSFALLPAGQVVRLPDFGEGEVLEVREDKLLVAFPDGRQKLFKRDFAQ